MRDVRSIHRRLFLIAAIAAAACGLATAAGSGERITATGVSPTKVGLPPSTVTIEINIDRWSTDAERDQLIDALKRRRGNALVDQLRSLPAVGHIATATSAGWSLRFAQMRSLEGGGRQVVLASDRPTTTSDDADYPISVVDIRFEKDGTGAGTLSYAANLTYDAKTGTIAVAHYASEPVRLTNVRSMPSS